MKIDLTIYKQISGKLGTLSTRFRHFSLYLTASFISSAISIIINPFLAANLSPEDYAIIGYFTSFNLLILPIVSFSLLSYYSRNYFKIGEDERTVVLNTLVISQLLIGLLGFIIFIVGFYIYFNISGVGFAFHPYALLCFIPTFFNCFLNFLLVERRMQRQAHSFFTITVLNALVNAGFAILLVVIYKKGAYGRFWAMLIPSVVFGIYSFRKLLSRVQFDKKVFRDALIFGWPISLSAILYYFIAGIDRAMLEKLDVTTFGYYNVAFQIVNYLYIFYIATSQTFEPDIYQSISENNRKKLLKLVISAVLINTIPTLLFVLLAHPLIVILTFGRYVESTEFAQIMALKHIPMVVCFLVSNIIIGYGYPRVELLNRFAGAALSILVYKLLINNYGFYGAAWGQSISFVLMTLISGTFIWYKASAQKNRMKRT